MNCLCATLRRAARQLTNFYEVELRAVGLTPSQFELLSLLQARPGISQADLAEGLGLDQTTLSRNIRLLLSRHRILQEGSPSDRRQAVYSLSSEGAALWHAALPHWRRANSAMQQILGREWASTMSLLENLGRNVPQSATSKGS